MCMYKTMLKILPVIFITFCSSVGNANTTIDNTQACTMRNLDITCQKGEKIKFDLIRTARDSRGAVFLKINTKDQIGEHIVLYINDAKPEVLKITKENGSFIPLNVIRKLRFATSLRFSISMKKGNPIVGSLNQHHFDWMKRFGKTCS